MKTISIISFLFLINVSNFAQTALGGKIITQETKDPAIFATLFLYRNDTLVTKATTDFDGVYNIENLTVGIYDLEINYPDYPMKTVTGILVIENKTNTQSVEIAKTENLYGLILCGHPIPMIQADDFTKGRIFYSNEIRRSPISKSN